MKEEGGIKSDIKTDMKRDMKNKIAMAAILIAATLIGVNALMSAVYRADHGAIHVSSL